MREGYADSPPALSAAEKLLQTQLSATNHERTRQSLTGLWNALVAMRTASVPDYSIARVGAFSEQHGGPKTQSIRNTNGAKFREIIEAFANDVSAPTQKKPRRPRSALEQEIDNIKDIGVRTALKMTIERSRRLERENDQLRSAFKNLSSPILFENNEAPNGIDRRQIGQIIPSNKNVDSMRIDPILIESIERFVSQEWMESRFWSTQSDGSIMDEVSGSLLIAPPGFVDALRLVLELQKG